MAIPRNEYPRPQLVRKDWINLNGEWDFEIDDALVGMDKNYMKRSSLDGKIIVPFCPESRLSGVAHTDFINSVWYRKDIDIPAEWSGKRVILHFGAVDYRSVVFINGEFVTEHKGGYSSFCVDISDKLHESGNYISLCAFDDVRSNNQPAGKQSDRIFSYGCSYTRTTGIWQTVWLECVNDTYIKAVRPIADIEKCAVNLEVRLAGFTFGIKVKVDVLFDGKVVGKAETKADSSSVFFYIPLSEKHLWDVGQGNLYDVKITVTKDEKETDYVESYFGLRTVGLNERAFMLNGRNVFGRWVLDQGFNPEGIYTYPDDEFMKNDVIYSMQLGFNGARLHERIFEPRFLYWCDKLGYLVWGEHANWLLEIDKPGQIEHFLPEWLEAIDRDFAHPSIIGWCPFNETHHNQCPFVVSALYEVTKAIDSTRPCIDTSGYIHTLKTDIFDSHDYCQEPEEFAKHYNGTLFNNYPDMQTYRGEPYFVSEYGGTRWDDAGVEGAWGYGNAPKTKEELIERYKGLTDVLLDCENMLGFCYTQLYDVEQETNGLMTYDRKFKIDPKVIYDINTREAAVEKLNK